MVEEQKRPLRFFVHLRLVTGRAEKVKEGFDTIGAAREYILGRAPEVLEAFILDWDLVQVGRITWEGEGWEESWSGMPKTG